MLTGSTADVMVMHADTLAQSAQWKEAFDVLASVGGELKLSHLCKMASLLCRDWHQSSGVARFHESVRNDWKSCSNCGGVLHQVVTLPCGHSYCRKCSDSWCLKQSCTKCGARPLDSSDSFKTNVAVSNLVEKWWSGELQAVALRAEGNHKFAERSYEEALEKYNAAALLAPNDFTLFSNRSNIYSKMAMYVEALRDADQVISLRQDWPKGQYRRAEALRGLGRNEEALIALLFCSALEKSPQSDICTEIAKVLMTIINSAAKQHNQHREDLSCGSEDSLSGTEELEPRAASNKIPIYSYPKLHRLVDRINGDMERLAKSKVNTAFRTVDCSAVDSSDFECTLCCRLLWQPVTTPCGHSFCRTCLDRCLDHNPSCPLCKTSLLEYLAKRKQSLTEFLDLAMATHLPEEYAERSQIHEQEMKEMCSQDKVPIFVCTLAFPTVLCPLHVFEPRYRLMIRRAMESGSRQFGMCAYLQNDPHGFAEYGTMLEVRDVEFFADGRSVVNTVGGRRFKVLHRTMIDGYYTATVDFLVDQTVEADHVDATVSLHDRVHAAAENWISEAPVALRQRILQHFGTMPPVEADWISLPNGPAWHWWLLSILPLDPKAQLTLLSMTSIEKRLEAIQRVVARVRQRML